MKEHCCHEGPGLLGRTLVTSNRSLTIIILLIVGRGGGGSMVTKYIRCNTGHSHHPDHMALTGGRGDLLQKMKIMDF